MKRNYKPGYKQSHRFKQFKHKCIPGKGNMTRSKKLKIQFYDMEILAPDKTSISLLTEILEKASKYERERGHLINHSEYMEIINDIERQIKE